MRDLSACIDNPRVGGDPPWRFSRTLSSKLELGGTTSVEMRHGSRGELLQDAPVGVSERVRDNAEVLKGAVSTIRPLASSG